MTNWILIQFSLDYFEILMLKTDLNILFHDRSVDLGLPWYRCEQYD